MKRAIVLPSVLSGIAVLVVLSSVILLLSNSEMSTAIRFNNGERGYYVAEYGLSQALSLMQTDTANNQAPFSGIAYTSTLAAGDGSNDQFVVHLYDASYPDPDGTVIPPNMSYMVCTATLANGLKRRAAVLIGRDGAGYTRAGFMANQFTVAGSHSSFDAFAGTPSNKKLNQNIIGTITSSGGINLSAGATIKGDILLPSGTKPKKAIVAGVTTSYSGVHYYSQTFVPPVVTDPLLPVATPPALGTGSPTLFTAGSNFGALSVGSGQKVDLQPGNYEFSSITVQSGGMLEILTGGPVNVTCTGNVDFQDDGTMVNMSGEARNFTLNVMGSTVRISSGAQAFLNLVAPKSQVAMTYHNTGISDLYGAVIADQVTVTNSSFHFDTSLLTSGGGPSPGQIPAVVARLRL